jgi:hypothetical protein
VQTALLRSKARSLIVDPALYLEHTFQKTLIPPPSSLALSTADLCIR